MDDGDQLHIGIKPSSGSRKINSLFSAKIYLKHFAKKSI